MLSIYPICGRPGSGKSVLGKILHDFIDNKKESENVQMLFVEFSDALREAGYLSLIKQGIMVGDDECMAVLTEHLNAIDKKSQQQKIVFLSGFPRTRIQAESLFTCPAFKIGDFMINATIEIKVSKETALKRMLERARPDDDEEKVVSRQEHYDSQTWCLAEIGSEYDCKIREYTIPNNGTIDEFVVSCEGFVKSLIADCEGGYKDVLS